MGDQQVLAMIKRAIDTADTAIQPEDLENLISMVTPLDTPLFRLFNRMPVTATLHEWVESTLTATLNTSVYADGSAPSANAETHTRKNNKVMCVGRIAKASNLLRAVKTVGEFTDAFALEVQEKMQDLIRCIEYWILNGDISNTSPQEMDGLLNIVSTTTVANGNAVLNEAKLQELVKKCYEAGGVPDTIVATPAVALQIANLASGKIHYNYADGEAMDRGTVNGVKVNRYMNPFGPPMDIIPERSSFLATGNVLVLCRNEIALGSVLSPVIQMFDLANTTDSFSRLLRAYVTLVVRNEPHHGILTGVTDV